MKRIKGLFVTFYNEVLSLEGDTFEFVKRKFAISCNSISEQDEVFSNIISIEGVKNVRYTNSIDISIFDVVEYKRYKMNDNFMWQEELPMNDNETYEWCPYCECEVIIKGDCTIKQTCPTCGKPIIACSVCDTKNCTNCALNNIIKKYR